MNINAVIQAALFSMVMLAGCSKNAPPSDGLPVAAPTEVAATPSPPTASDVVADPLADFTVDPGVVYSCDGRDRTESTVTWKVKDPSVTVRIEGDSTSDPMRKTFTIGGASGEARTENWVGAGTRFHLVDGASGKELAGYEVTSLPCQGASAEMPEGGKG